jgi:hypothetical protein
MNVKIAALAAIAFGATGVSAPAFAAINAPVPVANYITFNGDDWAWASPCPPSGGIPGSSCGDGSPIDLSYQSTLGWRLPTAAELAAGPSVSDFGTSSSFACASAWFSNYSHCDYFDAQGGAVYGAPGGGVWYAETWVTREGGVPEPATWALMISGFALVGAAMRRRASAAVAA